MTPFAERSPCVYGTLSGDVGHTVDMGTPAEDFESLAHSGLERATFGAGCFWSVEVDFRSIPGVVDVQVGYANGRRDNPTYEQVCSGATGHAEVVDLWFDRQQVSYGKLLDALFQIHDPTTPNRQGPDIGSQYRSLIATWSDEQYKIAEQKIQELEAHKRFPRPIVTEVTPATNVWRAEEYHQRYLEKHGRASCRIPQ